MGRVDRPAGEDDAAVGAEVTGLTALAEAHAAAVPALHDQAGRLSLGFDAQITVAGDRRQVSACGRAAKAPTAGHLRVADTGLAGAVDIRVKGETGLLGGGDELVSERQDGPIILDPQGPPRPR